MPLRDSRSSPGTGGAITSPDTIAIQVLALIPAEGDRRLLLDSGFTDVSGEAFGAERNGTARPQHEPNGHQAGLGMSLENVQTPEMTQLQRDALAERIAAVLRERKKIGAERRMQQRSNSERALARHRRLAEIHQPSPRLHGSPGYRIREINSRFEAIISSNAAFEA